jgi:hypothetical protein
MVQATNRILEALRPAGPIKKPEWERLGFDARDNAVVDAFEQNAGTMFAEAVLRQTAIGQPSIAQPELVEAVKRDLGSVADRIPKGLQREGTRSTRRETRRRK